MLRVNAINRQELLKCLTFNPKSLVFKTVSVPRGTEVQTHLFRGADAAEYRFPIIPIREA